MPFGLTNAPATFNGMMARIFHPHRKFTGVFFDDILAYSETKEEHETHLCHVLETLRGAQLYAKRSKCLFFVKKVDYLGYAVSKDGLSADLAKIKAVNN